MFLVAAVRASLDTGGERDSIWSVPRPLIRLYLFLFSLQTGWLFWSIYKNTAGEYPGSGLEFMALETMRGVSAHGLAVAMSTLAAVEGVSTLMVMYNLGMNLIVRPIIKWHERRGEARGIAIGTEQERERWKAWNQSRIEHQERGEPFDEPPPPPPPHQNGADEGW